MSVDNRTPEEIEQELIAKAEAAQQDPVELAATMFTLYLPRFQMLVNQLSNKALRRVLQALIEVPLNMEEFNHSTQAEKDAFAIGDRLLQAKWIMLQQAFMDNNKALQDATDPEVVPTEESVVANNQGENNNG